MTDPTIPDLSLLTLDLEIDPEGDSDYLRVTLRYDGETLTSDSVQLPRRRDSASYYY
jgi:hypothetical protein